ncbi:MAG: Holliday junction resolvase RuvX [Patescibacteria group bacterium]
MKFLGIDYGTKRVGLALSDEEGRVAFPKMILENNPQLIEKLKIFASENKAEGIVVGESLLSTGEENKIMAEARAFAERLGKGAELPVFFEKEFFTSVEARRHQEHTEVDDSAAALILQRYLDRQKG